MVSPNNDNNIIALTAAAHANTEATWQKIAAIESQGKRATRQFRIMLGIIILALGALLYVGLTNHGLAKDGKTVATFIRQINTPGSCYSQFNKYAGTVFKLDIENHDNLIHHLPTLPYPKPPHCKVNLP